MLDVAGAEHLAHLRSTGLEVVHLDEDPTRRVPREVKPLEHLDFVALDVEGQQIDLWIARVVEDAARSLGGGPIGLEALNRA